ncbi:FHA domain-containing protein [Nannocystis pusilla]|uniref:FHA domain-containing protein n=1 Tax=Nannocystis pusilla TaxID=889268 RepID=A0ABS7U412_9BACT|nr:FHA domain-containing protein [Nannocystis pusilla]MBZ5715045.1 FHA domain-containing protein [Nannocystis pusilla]
MQKVKLQLGSASVQLDASNPRVLLGRDPTCGLPTNEVSVSRRHAEVAFVGDQLVIRDMGSSNGTWINGEPVSADPQPLHPGQQVFLGHIPLLVEWLGGAQGGATVLGEMPAELKALIESRKAAKMAPTSPVAAAAAAFQDPPSQGGPMKTMLGIGGTVAPKAADYAYRRQGSNNNGVLLIALRGDTFTNAAIIDGYLEFTALDNETVASIFVELVEYHKRGPKNGHVWDRVLVRQGPWRTAKNEILPLTFQLRVPPGTSPSGRDVHWEVRGYVDIEWAYDISAASQITVRNLDIEKIRDALGALDYRLAELDPEPLGQRFTGKFQPPVQARKEFGITDINLAVEYLGANLQLSMEVEKTSLFKFDKQTKLVFELAQFRVSSTQQLSQFLSAKIDELMGRTAAKA